MKFTIRDFNHRFPTSEACLEEIKQLRFADFVCPKCGREDMLKKVTDRPQYVCPCGYQVSPLAGTIFHKSPTDLRTWFYAMYIMTQTRAGISAKQLERETGVTYKTAWRMFKQIRTLMMENGGDLLTGIVEVDETYVGGVQKGFKGRNPKGGNKTPVLGIVERGGRIRIYAVKDATASSLIPHIQANVRKGSWVMSDDLLAYKVLPGGGYNHRAVNHSRNFRMGATHTQTIEGFWSIFKSGVQSVYRHIGKNYVESYASEYAWRYSNRKSETPMFELLLNRAVQ